MRIPATEIKIEERIIVFVDIHNYSLAFDELDLLKSFSFLQETYEKLGDIIVGTGGEIIKYLGDSILSIFPAACAVEAVACALEMRKAFADLVVSKGLREDIELEVSIGAGQVAVGECGHQTLRQRDVFGNEVNRVVRIGYYQGVAITERVYEQVKASYRTQPLPDLTTKKPEQILKIWAAME